MIETPLADKIISGFNFKDEAGNPIEWGYGHKQILDIILARKAPDGKRRVHIMAHTRYGKSVSVGAGVAVRAATKAEKWAIVAGTKEKARIIMEYVINFVLDDPILRSQLEIEISLERLRRERSQDRLQFARRGEIRVYSADSKNRQQLGNALMGFGAPNVVEDEAGLIDDDIQSKVMRMLGDDAANSFLVKIGNPFLRNHFLKSFESERYYKINIERRRNRQVRGLIRFQHDCELPQRIVAFLARGGVYQRFILPRRLHLDRDRLPLDGVGSGNQCQRGLHERDVGGKIPNRSDVVMDPLVDRPCL